MNEQQSGIYKHSLKLEERATSLYVQNTGCLQCTSGHGWGPGVRSYYLLCHVISGRGTYVCRNRRYELAAGDTFLVYPNTTVQYKADEQEPWEYVWVGFGGLDAATYMDQTGFTPDTPICRGILGEQIRELMEAVCRSYGTSSWEELAMMARLYDLVSFLIRTAKPKEGRWKADRDCAQLAADYIVTNYEKPITVEELACYTSVSHSSLYRRFVKRYQMSPKRFMMEYRVERACQLLTTTDFSVQEISNSVGFEDPFYFSRAFKEIKGLSPRQYANSLRDKDD